MRSSGSDAAPLLWDGSYLFRTTAVAHTTVGRVARKNAFQVSHVSTRATTIEVHQPLCFSELSSIWELLRPLAPKN